MELKGGYMDMTRVYMKSGESIPVTRYVYQDNKLILYLGVIEVRVDIEEVDFILPREQPPSVLCVKE